MTTKVRIDSRICVKRSENGFNIDRQDVSIPDAVEILARILTHMRLEEFGCLSAKTDQVIDSFEHYPTTEPDETTKVCIAFDYETHKIQVAVIGLNIWEACVLVHTAQSYLTNLQLGLITE
jgi:hypothetical protein